MFCIISFKTIPNILLLLFLSPEFNKICLNEERNCIAETNILNKSFEVSFNIYVWWYIYIYWNNTKRFEGSIVYASYTHWYCKLKSRNRNPLCSQNDVGIYSATLSCLVFFLWQGIFLTISMIYLRELYKEMIVLILQVHHQMVVIRIKLRFLKQS